MISRKHLVDSIATEASEVTALKATQQRIATLEAALREVDATLDDSEHNLLLDCADGHQNRYRDNAVATLRTARRLIRAALAAQPAQDRENRIEGGE